MTAYALKRKIGLSLVLTLVLLALTAFIFTPTLSAAAEAVQQGDNTVAWVCIAAALAFGFGAIGAGMAISNVGSAAMAAISEKPDN